MSELTNKHWGVVIGILLVLITAWLGIGITALVIIFATIGYFVGKFLDGELDLEDIRARAQNRTRVRTRVR